MAAIIGLGFHQHTYNFYKQLETLWVQQGEKFNHNMDQTWIPNKLKYQQTNRRLSFHHIPPHTEINVSTLLGFYPVTTINIHIIKGTSDMRLILRRSPNENQIMTIQEHHSYQVHEDKLEEFDPEIDNRKNPEPLVVAIERNEHPKVKRLISWPRTLYTHTPEAVTYANRLSFLRKPLSFTELRNKIRFIDAEFAVDENKRFVPISVTILDYPGNILFHSLLCPRVRIHDYVTRIHGISEKHLLGAMDIEEGLHRIQKLMFDSVIIGHDLHMEIEHLQIEKKHICGVRDLCTSSILKDMLHSTNQFLKLEEVTRVILQRKIQTPGHHNSMEDTRAVRDIYLTIEDLWKDSEIPRTHEDFRTPTPPPPTPEPQSPRTTQQRIQEIRTFFSKEEDIGTEPDIMICEEDEMSSSNQNTQTTEIPSQSQNAETIPPENSEGNEMPPTIPTTTQSFDIPIEVDSEDRQNENIGELSLTVAHLIIPATPMPLMEALRQGRLRFLHR